MKDLIKLFLKLGTFGFGGPVATMAMMEEEAVKKRNWLDYPAFNQAYALCKVLPGPAATQMAIYIGYLKKGFLGGTLTGICFMLPAFVLLLVLSWAYFHYGSVSWMENFFWGANPIVLVVILHSVYRMAQPYMKNLSALVIMGVAFVLMLFFSGWEALILIGLGFIYLFWKNQAWKNKSSLQFLSLAGFFSWTKTDTNLLLIFLKAGALIFGGGLAIIPLLEHTVVDQFHFMTRKEFLDGLTLGQLTPGPVVITATFIGYKVAQLKGALISTFGIFFPSFVFIFGAAPFLNKIKKSKKIQLFVDGAIFAVIGTILATTLTLAPAALSHWGSVAILILTLLVLKFFKPPAWVLIPSGGIVGWIVKSIF